MTRAEILEAAARIISEKGFDAASMQDIADSVSLQKASLYHHFDSKQEILLALLDQALDLLIERMEGVMAQPVSPEEKLRQAVVSYLQILAESRNLSSVLLLEHRSLQPELRASHLPRRDRFEQLWRDLLASGKAVGAFDVPDVALSARVLLGAMNWTITWYRPDGPLSATKIANYLADQFLHGLQKRC
jgi:AcrR family transcriptional regulator